MHVIPHTDQKGKPYPAGVKYLSCTRTGFIKYIFFIHLKMNHLLTKASSSCPFMKEKDKTLYIYIKFSTWDTARHQALLGSVFLFFFIIDVNNSVVGFLPLCFPSFLPSCLLSSASPAWQLAWLGAIVNVIGSTCFHHSPATGST